MDGNRDELNLAAKLSKKAGPPRTPTAAAIASLQVLATSNRIFIRLGIPHQPWRALVKIGGHHDMQC